MILETGSVYVDCCVRNWSIRLNSFREKKMKWKLHACRFKLLLKELKNQIYIWNPFKKTYKNLAALNILLGEYRGLQRWDLSRLIASIKFQNCYLYSYFAKIAVKYAGGIYNKCDSVLQVATMGDVDGCEVCLAKCQIK